MQNNFYSGFIGGGGDLGDSNPHFPSPPHLWDDAFVVWSTSLLKYVLYDC